MSNSEIVLSRHFEQVVGYYHPYAEYLGFTEYGDYFVVAYQGIGEPKFMVLDEDLDVVADETVGTTRWGGALSLLSDVIDAWNRNY